MLIFVSRRMHCTFVLNCISQYLPPAVCRNRLNWLPIRQTVCRIQRQHPTNPLPTRSLHLTKASRRSWKISLPLVNLWHHKVRMALRPEDVEPQLSRPLLLQLPFSIRHRIYLYLGIALWDGELPSLIDLRGPFRRKPEAGVYSLLLSCRALYGEVSRLLFSSNVFVIHYRPVYGRDARASLQPLWNLTDSSLASLRQLKIVLSQNGCHEQKPVSPRSAYGLCCSYPRTTHYHFEEYCKKLHAHDQPLQSSQHLFWPLLDEWRRMVRHLASRIRPHVLDLALVCDLDHTLTDSEATARKIVEPLISLPPLRHCQVRLSKSHKAGALAEIARRAVLKACRWPEVAHHLTPSSSPGAAGFRRLPREVRLRVLEYTDLIIPSGEVMWTKFERAYSYLESACGIIEGESHCSLTKHHSCQFSGCHASGYPRDGTLGCFCRARHADFSPKCRCWAAPTPLFLVCKNLTEDARFIFFSQNRFVISDSLTAPCPYIPFDIPANIPWPERPGYYATR